MLRLLPFLLLAAQPAAAREPSADAADAPTLTADGDAGAGHVTLSWSAGGGRYQLQWAPEPDFAHAITRYDGPHTSSVRSGMPNGVNYFRVRRQTGGDAEAATWSAWSEPVRFEVKHHSRMLAFSLCGLGAFVFASTGLFLMRASRRHDD